MGKKQNSKHERRLPDKERWYRLEAVFDDKNLAATAIRGAFFRGALDKLMVVEVQADFPDEQYGALAKWLENHGIEAMVVKEGVRFLKIAPADKGEQEVLEAHYLEELAKPAKEAADPETAEIAADL